MTVISLDCRQSKRSIDGIDGDELNYRSKVKGPCVVHDPVGMDSSRHTCNRNKNPSTMTLESRVHSVSAQMSAASHAARPDATASWLTSTELHCIAICNPIVTLLGRTKSVGFQSVREISLVVCQLAEDRTIGCSNHVHRIFFMSSLGRNSKDLSTGLERRIST